MSKKFLRIFKGTAFTEGVAPSDPVAGDVYFDSTTKKLMGYVNGVWNTLDMTAVSGGGGGGGGNFVSAVR